MSVRDDCCKQYGSDKNNHVTVLNTRHFKTQKQVTVV